MSPPKRLPRSISHRLTTDDDLHGGRLKATGRVQARACRFGSRSGSDGRYSISLSALSNNAGGTVTPMALAVFRLITSSNLVGCSTGRLPEWPLPPPIEVSGGARQASL